MSDPTPAEQALAEAVFDDHRTNLLSLIRAFYTDAASRGLAMPVIRERVVFELIAIAALMRPEHVDFIQAATAGLMAADRINNGVVDQSDAQLN
jgi:hypothetical protein